MQQKSFFTRLKEVFFPPKFVAPLTMVRRHKGTDAEFFDWLERNNFKVSRVNNEPNSRVYVYTEGEIGKIIGLGIRWPNKMYYYQVVQF